jgi:hypothetical protein
LHQRNNNIKEIRWKNGKNKPEEKRHKRNPVLPTYIGEKNDDRNKHTHDALCTSTLTAALLHYNAKYRKIIKENAS